MGTEGNGHDGPTQEEKDRIKEKVLEAWDKQQEEKKKQEEK
jgi:hypothetical protein